LANDSEIDKKEIEASQVGSENERLDISQQPTQTDEDPDAYEGGASPVKTTASISLN